MSVRDIFILALQRGTCHPQMYIQAAGIKSNFKYTQVYMPSPALQEQPFYPWASAYDDGVRYFK